MLFQYVCDFLYFAGPLIFILGALLLFFVVFPDVKVLVPYRKARRGLAFAYLFFGLLFQEDFLFGSDQTEDLQSASFVWLMLSSIQAFLFTYVLVVLIDSVYFTKRRFFCHVIPISCFLLLSICCLLFGSVSIKKVMIVCYLLFYLFQLIYYTWIFISRYNLYLKAADNFYAENEAARLRWVKVFFFSYLTIGVSALVFVFFRCPELEIYHSLFCCLFYAFFLLKYLNYPHDFYSLRNLFVEENIDAEEISSTKVYDEKLKEWIDKQEYCTPGITISMVASALQLNANKLSTHINTHEQMNFNQWINKHRTEEAKRLLAEDSKKSIADIARETGFSNCSAFSRQFKLIEGVSPLAWRKGIGSQDLGSDSPPADQN